MELPRLPVVDRDHDVPADGCTHFFLKVRCRKFNSSWRFSWQQMAFGLCVKVDTIECFLARWWCGLAFKHLFVWIALLKAVLSTGTVGVRQT